jgi:hypothetical protein
MTSRLYIEPLRVDHLIEIAAELLVEQVYEHIGGVPSLENFVRDRENALRGPKSCTQKLERLMAQRTFGQQPSLRLAQGTLNESD